jgi:hypothetical protein
MTGIEKPKHTIDSLEARIAELEAKIGWLDKETADAIKSITSTMNHGDMANMIHFVKGMFKR